MSAFAICAFLSFRFKNILRLIIVRSNLSRMNHPTSAWNSKWLSLQKQKQNETKQNNKDTASDHIHNPKNRKLWMLDDGWLLCFLGFIWKLHHNIYRLSQKYCIGRSYGRTKKDSENRFAQFCRTDS